MNEQEQIAAGERVERFLADEAVTYAFSRLEAAYVAKWKASTSAEERETLHAKSAALDDLRTELRAIVDSGKRAKVEQSRRNSTTRR